MPERAARRRQTREGLPRRLQRADGRGWEVEECGACVAHGCQDVKARRRAVTGHHDLEAGRRVLLDCGEHATDALGELLAGDEAVLAEVVLAADAEPHRLVRIDRQVGWRRLRGRPWLVAPGVKKVDWAARAPAIGADARRVVPVAAVA
eukprot:5263058-Prymnesium_polylepis.2